MKIDVQIKVNEDNIIGNTGSSEIASGWVELEDCIKFPVKVRKYMDKKENKEKMFVSYPQRKTDHGYEAILYPSDKSVRDEIDRCVLDSVKDRVLKGVGNPPITDVRVNLMKSEKQYSSVAIRGIASIKLAGITINGIMIKEGKNGLFVQMPQHKSNGEYKDTVYGTNSMMQSTIRSEVMYAYEKEIEKQQMQPEKSQDENQQLQEQPEDQQEPLEKSESIEMFLAAYESGDIPGMLAVLENSMLDVDREKLVENGKAVESQYASITAGEDALVFRFQNNYDEAQVMSPEASAKQKIEAFIYKDGTQVGSQMFYEKDSQDPADAGKNYQEMLGQWRKMTGQESVAEMPQIEMEPEHPDKPRSVRMFLEAFERRDTAGMLAVLEKAELEIEQTRFTSNGNAVKWQSAILEAGSDQISLRFYNDYDPIQVAPPKDYISQKIEAVIFKNGNVAGISKLTELESKSLKNAEKNYQKLLGQWKELTRQDMIKFEETRHQEKQFVRNPVVSAHAPKV